MCALALALIVACAPKQKVTEPPDFTASSEPEFVPERYQKLYRPGLAKKEEDQLRAELPYDSISLHRTPCFGSCPVYTVTFHRSGKAEFEATQHLPDLGRFTGEIDVFTYGRLCYLIDNSHFRQMKGSYRAQWTDDTTCIVTIMEGARRTEVSDYGRSGPIELWAIQELIDSIRKRIEWKPVP